MENLLKQIKNCKKCALKDGRTNIVFGSGNVSADLMVIGEAPGKNEDEQGLPFVGKAGQYLDELLKMAGLKRDDVYIANVVKCRPPSNRNPYADEILNCAPYLREQTKIVDPKIIVTLGNFATKFILKSEKGITLLHGQKFKVGKFIVYPVFHPASTMYDPKKKSLLETDFKNLKDIIKNAKFENES